MTKNIVLSKSFKKLSFFATVLVVSLALGNFVFAVWSEPGTAPPGGNAPTPINTSVDAQIKDGDLSVAALYDAVDPAYFIDLDSAVTSGVFKSKIGIGMVPTNANLEIDMGASAAEGLHISRTAAGPNSYFNVENELGNPIFKIHENGNVGIGTNDPSTAQLQIEGDGSGDPGDAEITLKHTGAGGSAGITFDVDAIPFYIKANADRLKLGTVSGGAKMVIMPDGDIGIGTSDPTQKLEVSGGVRLNTADARPACGATTRGTFWFIRGAVGVKDSVAVCAKDAANAYDWRVIY